MERKTRLRLKEKKRYYFDSQSWNKYKEVLLVYSLANLTPSFLSMLVLPWPFALSHTAEINHTRLLFSQIKNPSTYIWNTMIRGYSEAKMGHSGFLFLCQVVIMALKWTVGALFLRSKRAASSF